jgi:hypothetical protein
MKHSNYPNILKVVSKLKNKEKKIMQGFFIRKASSVFLIGFVLSFLAVSMSAQNMFRKVNDFDGDGKADFAITRAENGLKVWYLWQSTAGFSVFQWGLGSDQNAAGDYDGDGRTDFAVHRIFSNPDNVVFYILQSQTNSLVSKNFFRHNFNRPMQQDYDGDGKTDPANWASDGSGGGVSIFLSTTNTLGGYSIPFNDGPLKTGDMDGDGHADPVTVSNGTPNNVKITNFVTQATRSVQFGVFLDDYVPADFDGDGIGDLTVFRNSDGTWWWLRSSDNVVNAAAWGTSGDFPVPADYDGDGKTDLAIYRRESPQSHYWINGSQNGVSVFAWGLTNDRAVQY